MPVMPVIPVMTAVVPDNTMKSVIFLAMVMIAVMTDVMLVMTAVMTAMTAVLPDNTTKSVIFLAMVAMTVVAMT
jgi:hypothetical protein